MDRFVIRKTDKRPKTGENEEAGGIVAGTSRDMEEEPRKKRKVRPLEAENRQFQEKWTEDFLFVPNESSTKALCLICTQTCAAFKRSNIERHFTKVHADFNDKYLPGTNLRKNKIEQLSSLLKGQQKLLQRSTTVSESLTEASFEIAWILAKHKKAFTDAEVVKECFLASAEIMYADFSNQEAILKQIKGLQLSDTTIARRVEVLAKDIRQQLTEDMLAAPCFSLALDESTDVCDIAQLCVWARFPKEETFREEVLCLLPLAGQTRGLDVLNALLDFFSEHDLTWSKLASVCTDGAPNMRGKENGLIGLMRKREDMPKFASFHCIIHQEALVAKLKNAEMQSVMQLVVKVVNFIVSRALNHRQFRALLNEYNTEYGDLLMHSEVRWLSRGRVLERFLNLLPQIREFLESKGRREAELENPEWVMKLAFLTDITCHLNVLNLQLQGKCKLPGEMLRDVTAFQNKITALFIPDREFVHFPKLKEITTEDPELLKSFNRDAFVQLLEELRAQFDSRFEDVNKYKDMFNFIESPFNVPVASLSPIIADLCSDRAKLESEIIELQTNDILQHELQSGVHHFWNMVPDTFPTVKHCVKKVLSFFVSTYACEATFSTMSIVKRKQRNRLTNEHLDSLTRIAMTEYRFRMKKVKEHQAHFRSSSF